MPSPRAVLADINDLGLNPNVGHNNTSATGRLKNKEHKSDVVEEKLVVETVQAEIVEEVVVSESSDAQLEDNVVLDEPETTDTVVSQESNKSKKKKK
jgi:hypothetical protein